MGRGVFMSYEDDVYFMLSIISIFAILFIGAILFTINPKSSAPIMMILLLTLLCIVIKR